MSVVRSRLPFVEFRMRTILTISIVLAALILVQASSSKEFTFVETVKIVIAWITLNEKIPYIFNHLYFDYWLRLQ